MSRRYDYDDYNKCNCSFCIKKYDKCRCNLCEEYKRHKRCHCNKHKCKSSGSYKDSQNSCDSSSDKESVKSEPPTKCEQPKSELTKCAPPTKYELCNNDKCGKYVVITINSFDSKL